MAELLELAQFQELTVTSPGEPPDPDIVAANDFRRRIRMLITKRSVAFMRANPDPKGQDKLENLAFAQQFLRSPSPHLDSAVNLILAQAPVTDTIADIIGVDDNELNTQITNADLQLLARGLVPGR